MRGQAWLVALCLASGAVGSGCLAEDPPPRPAPKTAFCTRLQERGDAAFTRNDFAFLDREAERAKKRDPKLARRLREIAEEARLEGDLAIYLKKGVSDRRRKKIDKVLDKKFPKLRAHEYISSPRALKAFKKKYADRPELFETLGRKDLPPYYLVEVGPESPAEVAKAALEVPFVEEVITEDELRAKALRRIGALCDL